MNPQIIFIALWYISWKHPELDTDLSTDIMSEALLRMRERARQRIVLH